MKRLLKISVVLLLLIWAVRAFALLFRTVYNNVKDGAGAFDGLVWKNILLPRFDGGFHIDRIGEVVACLGAAWLIVKRKLKLH